MHDSATTMLTSCKVAGINAAANGFVHAVSGLSVGQSLLRPGTMLKTCLLISVELTQARPNNTVPITTLTIQCNTVTTLIIY